MRCLKEAVLVLCLIAMQCVTTADAEDAGARHPREGLPALQPSETCLMVHHDGAIAYWVNRCPYPVTVRWSDDAKCRDWSCQGEIPADTRLSAAISTHARWCECRGTLSTCRLPTNGC